MIVSRVSPAAPSSPLTARAAGVRQRADEVGNVPLTVRTII